MIVQSDKSLKQAIESLIEAGTTFNLEQLELVYHENLKVFMVDHKGKSNVLDKNMVKSMFQSKKENGDAPLNDWFEISNMEIEGNLGHAIVIRKVNLTGAEQKFVFSLNFRWEKDRWQVFREVAVVQPQC
ncbi:hypothetical protein C9994_04420 [Marivirga lumbricoides]|uniref:Nuclear transport factor 2 family protein n=1 Tax=Marivirga lumbricoides TaxID=1046115 RepID=A0A2T4DTI8_9BACT|nr:hypothetical protein C9994_04420 [Marivirga lumbricoides]